MGGQKAVQENEEGAVEDCGVGQDFHVDDHMRRASPLPKPPRAEAKLANAKTAKPEPS